MEFEERLKTFIKRIEKIKDKITNEEATKTSIIMPFFQILGYDIFNPNEFIPEYIADVGIKKGEKVDYAIMINDEVTILIEAKSITQKLEKHDSQLFRYFGTSSAKFAILTNGVIYKFFTDLDESNKMDNSPFLEIDLLNIQDNEILELKKFTKENFNIDLIFNSASDLKYLSSIEKVLNDEFNNPSDEFTKIILNKGVYDGVKTQNIIDKYKPILKKSITNYINGIINEKLRNLINENHSEKEETKNLDTLEGIITTEEEIESYYTVKSILSEKVDPERIFYKDTYSYFGILFDDKVTKWICRVYLKENIKYIIIADENKKEIKHEINSIKDIYKYKDELIKRLNSIYKIWSSKKQQKLLLTK